MATKKEEKTTFSANPKTGEIKHTSTPHKPAIGFTITDKKTFDKWTNQKGNTSKR